MKNYRTYCGNTATSTQGACGTTRQSNVTYNYYNCYANGSASSQTCPSGYTAGGNVGVKNYRTYCGNTATSTQGACGTTRQSNVTYNYSSCYASGSTGGQSCPSGYSGSSIKNYRNYCGNTATSTQGACGTVSEKNVTYNLTGCSKPEPKSGWTSYSGYYYNSNPSDSQCVRTSRTDTVKCTDTAAASTGSCSTSTTTGTTYKNGSTGGQSCPRGYTYGGNLGVKNYRTHLTCTSSTSNSCGSSETVDVSYSYGSCYNQYCGGGSSSTATGQACPSGYTYGGNLGKKTTTVYPTMRQYYGSSAYTYASSGCKAATTSYDYSSCYNQYCGSGVSSSSSATGQACPSGYTAGGNLAKKTTTTTVYPTMRQYHGASAYQVAASGCKSSTSSSTMDYSACYGNKTENGNCYDKLSKCGGNGASRTYRLYYNGTTGNYSSWSIGSCFPCICSIGDKQQNTDNCGTSYKTRYYCKSYGFKDWSKISCGGTDGRSDGNC